MLRRSQTLTTTRSDCLIVQLYRVANGTKLAARNVQPCDHAIVQSGSISNVLGGLQLAIRAALSGGAALALATLGGFAHPIFSFIAAVVVTDLSPRESRKSGVRQIVGTMIGACCGLVLSLWLPQSIWAAATGVLIAMVLCSVLGAQGGARLAGFTCGIIVTGSQGPPWEFAAFRLAEIALGVVVAWVVSSIPKLIPQED